MEKLKCPDCGQELNTVVAERFFTKTLDLDYESKTIMEKPSTPENDWAHDDTAYHCPFCDSLNVDELFRSWSEKRWIWSCRYCEHMKNATPPRQKYIGMAVTRIRTYRYICEYGLQPETCGRYEPAACYEGHDPMKD